jgi:prepilin-type N-terminal cleavage/methylation domain-containing protein
MNKGFTLIELVISIAIIAILVTAATSSCNNHVEKKKLVYSESRY